MALVCCSNVWSTWKGNWDLSLLYKAQLSWCERCIEVTYVLSECLGNDNCGEEEGAMIILALRGAVCWVFFAGHISCVEMDVLHFNKGVDVLEDFVCGFVATSALSPTLNDSSFVPKDFDRGASGGRWDRVRMKSQNPTASAQLMSLPSAFQPGRSLTSRLGSRVICGIGAMRGWSERSMQRTCSEKTVCY